MSLSYEQKLKVAEMAKDITISFGGKLHITNSSTKETINKSVSEIVNQLYTETYSTILELVEKE